MTSIETKRIEVCVPGVKAQFQTWCAERGGIIIWEDHNLSRLGPNTFTPARNAQGESNEKNPPHWGYVLKETITDIARFRFIKEEKELARFKIALRQRGMKVELTSASSKRVRSKCDHFKQIHGVAPSYVFDPPGPLGFLSGPVECVILLPVFED